MKSFVAFSLLFVAYTQAKFIRLRPPHKIVGGEEAVPHSFPHQAALSIDLPQGTVFCGGSVISENRVLTAAHCVSGASAARVTLGAHNISAVEPDTQVIEASRFIVHEKWSSLFIRNDIAIIVLGEKININGVTVKQIELAREDENPDVETVATVSGWGKDSDESTTKSSVLRFVTSTIMSNEECNRYYFGNIRDTNICLNGEGGKSSCNGDSGGPLIVTSGDTVTQHGIVSFGIAFGCEINWPSAYTRVSKYRSWIDSNL